MNSVSLISVNKNRSFFEALKKRLELLGHSSILWLDDSDETEGYQIRLAEIQQSDIVIIDLMAESIGAGLMLEHAAAEGKRAIGIVENGLPLSAFIKKFSEEGVIEIVPNELGKLEDLLRRLN